jgi:hypothetical protein
VDTWWQTETGGIMISPLPGATTTKPGSATFPLPGISADIVDEGGESVGIPGGGYLVLDEPWPSMLRGIWGDDQRYRDTYWSRFPGRYFAGDGAKRDEDGYFWLLGRVDDVMNISGHRISTTEVESALVSHESVAEAAVVGRHDSQTGQAIAAFVTPRKGIDGDEALAKELRDHVATMISPIAKPASLLFTADLPKTRSGKIMRRLLKDIAEDKQLGDTSTLADASIVDEIKQRYVKGRAVTVVFVLNGALVASWIVRIPATQSRLGVGEGTLGVVLMGLAVGVLLALPLAGGLVARIGSRGATLPWLRIVDRTGRSAGAPRFAWPHGALVPLALVALASTLGESTASDWSGVHLRDIVGVDPGRAPWGFVAFTAAMVAARLSGDVVTRRLGASTVVRLGGSLAGLGFVLVAAVPTLPAALIGFAMVGLGVAPIVPLVFSAAAAVGRSAGEGIGAVATVGYGGFLAGPARRSRARR